MKYFILLAGVFLGFKSFAVTAPKISAVQDSSCQASDKDPNDLGYSFTENSKLYKGDCINSEISRPIRNLNLLGPDAIFDNYLHTDKFWKAQVPTGADQIEAAYFQIMRFPVVEGVIAAHTQIRFVFKNKNAVQLTRGIEIATSDDILISYEAAFPKDVAYNFALGSFENYALFGKVMSTAQKQSGDGKNVIEQYPLELTPVELSQLLKNTLEHSEAISITSFYNTFKPNCTTEVFDLIDSLPRFKDQPRFLTMLSGDPIAGPSIYGLLERKLITKRVQDFNKEQQGIKEDLAIPIPPKNPMPAFFPTVEGMPWAISTVSPDPANMTELEAGAIGALRRELVASIPSLLQSYGAVMTLAPGAASGKQLFLSTLKEIVARAPIAIARVNEHLPEKPVEISLFFSPFEMEGDYFVTSLVPYGIPAAVPFAINEFYLDSESTTDGIMKNSEIFRQLGMGIVRAGDKGSAQVEPPAYLQGVTITVHAQKDNSKVITQVAVGVNETESELVSDSPQVSIKKVGVPGSGTGPMAWVERPMMIITHAQDAKGQAQDKINPLVDVQFGAFGGFAGPESTFGSSTLEIFKGWNCWAQTKSTPYFDGIVNDKLIAEGWKTAINGIAKGTPIRFHLTGMTLNIGTQQVESMKLQISLLYVLSCMEDPMANQMFSENANKAITDMMNKVENQGLMQMISPLLN